MRCTVGRSMYPVVSGKTREELEAVLQHASFGRQTARTLLDAYDMRVQHTEVPNHGYTVTLLWRPHGNTGRWALIIAKEVGPNSLAGFRDALTQLAPTVKVRYHSAFLSDSFWQ